MNNHKPNIARELVLLKSMSAGELREKYFDLFGEETRSGNRQWMLRRCAWRVQALAEGGLSEMAIRRAKDLARDQDIRVVPPKGMSMSSLDHEPDVVVSVREKIHRTRDDRLPMPGTQLTRVYKGHKYVIDVLAQGFAYEGQRYRSLSAIAHVITGSHWNGYRFFNIPDPRKEIK